MREGEELGGNLAIRFRSKFWLFRFLFELSHTNFHDIDKHAYALLFQSILVYMFFVVSANGEVSPIHLMHYLKVFVRVSVHTHFCRYSFTKHPHN